jgi:hypothetical protein
MASKKKKLTPAQLADAIEAEWYGNAVHEGKEG